MVITYLGVDFFKIQFGDTVIAVNPISKESRFKGPRFGADIAVVSLDHPDLNGAAQVALGPREPFLVNGPGEYEVKDVFIKGIGSESRYGGEARQNTMYTISLEGMNLCFLGALGGKTLPDEARGALDGIDVLFVPIGGGEVLGPAEASELAVSLEPKLIIPSHFGGVGDKDALRTFLKAAGEEKTEELEKLTLKRKDLEGKEGEVAVIAPAR